MTKKDLTDQEKLEKILDEFIGTRKAVYDWYYIESWRYDVWYTFKLVLCESMPYYVWLLDILFNSNLFDVLFPYQWESDQWWMIFEGTQWAREVTWLITSTKNQIKVLKAKDRIWTLYDLLELKDKLDG
jgi:hypothetical protein